ncbi:putative phage abortive infection protein [Butyricimonas paravirosa]|uniref:putative phage abortive infection protein n=1 Tax=Butyricimonas paravirosa TaxID=1472417 RepID=UPI00210CE267|nr:putative phage abortive infection protein [Butyricimonas paravirosa]MCQ4872931.1 putative phage abortive infection protein [Butyricimonas paravirosa]
MKYKTRHTILSFSAIGLLALLLFIVGKYIWIFHGGISEEHQRWGEFGNFFGCVTSLLAFIGVLYTIRQTNIQEERSIFFQLLELYKDKVHSMVYSNSQIRNKSLKEEQYPQTDAKGRNETGLVAFELYTNKLQNYFVLYLLYKRTSKANNEDDLWYDVEDESTLIKLNKSLYSLFNAISVDFFITFKYKMNNNFENTLKILSSNMDDQSLSLLGTYLITSFKKNHDYKNIYLAMKYAADTLYSDNQQYLGQYFRTIYYILDTIKDFKNWSIDSKIFRSQLSRYELIVLLFNMISSQSTKKTINLYKECDIFNNLYLNDIYFNSNIASKSNDRFIYNILKEFSMDTQEKN